MAAPALARLRESWRFPCDLECAVLGVKLRFLRGVRTNFRCWRCDLAWVWAVGLVAAGGADRIDLLMRMGRGCLVWFDLVRA